MECSTILTGTIMLETMWQYRRKDLLDLITPFIEYAVAKTTTVSQPIDIAKVSHYVKENFGYTDILEAVVEKVLKRNSDYYKKSHNQFFLKKDLSEAVERLDQKREECEARINNISTSLRTYLIEHCTSCRKLTNEGSIHYLQDFFSRYGLYVGTDRLYSKDISVQNYEIDYYIAQYIFDLKDRSSVEYQYVIDLVKGFFLQSALYLQIDNNDLINSSYNGVKFYYDTPFLLRILGYVDEHSCNSARELHQLLKKQGGKFYYFPQTHDEIDSILTAYGYSLNGGRTFSKTLEGLDAHNYSIADVERLRTIYVDVLKSTYQINLADLPPYKKKADGTIDESVCLSEIEAKQFVRDNTKHYREETLKADIASAMAIHRLRTSERCRNIEHCGAIFVTTNPDFTRAFNTYYKSNVNRHTFPLIILDSDLASIAWIKCGSIGTLPERQLLTNAYSATVQLMPDLNERLKEVLDMMQVEGKISPETALVLRSSHFTQKELFIASHGDVNNITSEFVENAIKKYDDSIIHSYKTESEKEEQEKQDLQQKQIIGMARKIAAEQRDKLLKCMSAIWIALAATISCFAIYFTIKYQCNFVTSLPQMLIACFAALSIYDTVKSRNIFIHRVLLLIANRYETKIYEKKKLEYQKAFLVTASSAPSKGETPEVNSYL